MVYEIKLISKIFLLSTFIHHEQSYNVSLLVIHLKIYKLWNLKYPIIVLVYFRTQFKLAIFLIQNNSVYGVRSDAKTCFNY